MIVHVLVISLILALGSVVQSDPAVKLQGDVPGANLIENFAVTCGRFQDASAKSDVSQGGCGCQKESNVIVSDCPKVASNCESASKDVDCGKEPTNNGTSVCKRCLVYEPNKPVIPQTKECVEEPLPRQECIKTITNISPILINQINNEGEKCSGKIDNAAKMVEKMESRQKSLNDQLTEISKQHCDTIMEQKKEVEAFKKERNTICEKCRKTLEDYEMLIKKLENQNVASKAVYAERDTRNREELDSARQMLICLQGQITEDAIRNQKARQDLLKSIDLQKRIKEEYSQSSFKRQCEFDRLRQDYNALKLHMKTQIDSMRCRDCEIKRLKQIISTKVEEIIKLQHSEAKEKERSIVLEKEVECMRANNESIQNSVREGCQETNGFKKKVKELEHLLKIYKIMVESLSNEKQQKHLELILLDENSSCKDHLSKEASYHAEALKAELMQKIKEEMRCESNKKKGYPCLVKREKECKCEDHTTSFEFAKDVYSILEKYKCGFTKEIMQRKKKSAKDKERMNSREVRNVSPYTKWDIGMHINNESIAIHDDISRDESNYEPIDPLEVCDGGLYFPKKVCASCNKCDSNGIMCPAENRDVRYISGRKCGLGLVTVVWRQLQSDCKLYEVILDRNIDFVTTVEGSRLDSMIKNFDKASPFKSSNGEYYLFDMNSGVYYTKWSVKFIKSPIFDYRGSGVASIILPQEKDKNPFSRYGVSPSDIVEYAKSIWTYDSATLYINEEYRVTLTDASSGNEVKFDEKPDKLFISKGISPSGVKKLHSLKTLKSCDGRVLNSNDFSLRCFGGPFRRNNELKNLVLSDNGTLTAKYMNGKYNVVFTFSETTSHFLHDLSSSNIKDWPIVSA